MLLAPRPIHHSLTPRPPLPAPPHHHHNHHNPAVPGDNSVDLFTNDLGLVVITNDKGELEGFNVVAGGGMGERARAWACPQHRQRIRALPLQTTPSP